ncbi:MAG: LLM class F420-dependent oxidoreductase [SAR202 cluster bacterium]|jgi:probable F420-dependent oxidoreductase|uniref:Luciferase-like domain-containing protein n=2 Tax=ecological metagenomes TaxID=410657 RepID=A0A381PFM1_9ZZZZ|nr:LLM class F420-dependent oxidoreductase [Dehalococcoidia bacterium]MEC9289940.1 LLM class F420-dependent oxidoreductase [Chloroflexota bacterium]MQG13153.1 LLM class F420-dependent oxidoreductase [SAR202 cluster bacterium]MED5587699.1 LLM class F420-dependent oxidoreductase [Chloroflexota bacterium]MQG32039.1 LLM class F420-dependent oxidoreductase [SAR202 cluster bacterium]|tara:strand:+ start:272 stop:1114 length:843 start_codon:yes stop_codon:yes gene_type:complete
MNIGTSVPLPAYTIDPAFMAKKAEDLGFESIWYAEHAAVPVHSDSPFPATGGEIPWTYSHFTDPYIALARASGVTTKIKLGTGITLVPERNPLLLAKEIATLDRYSGGRFLFGIGTGWLKEETEMMGGDFEHRWTQTREAIEVMKELWTKEEAEYHGRYFDFPLVRSYPKPAQKPYPPIILGGMAKNVLRRVVTHADGWLPNRVTPTEVEESRKKLDAMAAEAGRDPKSITISVYGQLPERDIVHSLLNAGADRVVVRPEHVETEKEMGEQLERMAEAVL